MTEKNMKRKHVGKNKPFAFVPESEAIEYKEKLNDSLEKEAVAFL